MELTYMINELPQVAQKVLATIQTKNVLFYGAMGVGKTTLIKELANSLGVKDSITSPTFSIVNEYSAQGSTLYHFDFYRIEDEEEAMDIGIEEYFESGAYNFIEWPEKIAGILPETHSIIEITKNNNQSRTLKITPVN